jgi:oxygen-independent coproporphyrinogen-3 oxidase
MHPFSIYIHIPFCEKRCNYCDFNTYAGVLDRLPRYIDALCQEIAAVAKTGQENMPVHTVYFGGGTPSLAPADSLARILSAVRENYELAPQAEITLEANPGTLSLRYLRELRRTGVNRLSIGMQSASNKELSLLGRIHRFKDVRQSLDWARAAGFDNLNLDLIYGLPYQTLKQWEANLNAALRLQPQHLSLYALTLEPHVPMARQITAGNLPCLDDDLSADMYEMAAQLLEKAGFAQYEISNWSLAKKGTGEPARDLRSQHNLQYWLNLPYLGFGAGAHGFAAGIRTENLSRINAYIERCASAQANEFPRGPALKTAVRIDRRREMQETMMMGLRLNQGVNPAEFQSRFGVDCHQVFGREIDRMIKLELLEENPPDGSIKLTRKGRFLSNVVFRGFVD